MAELTLYEVITLSTLIFKAKLFAKNYSVCGYFLLVYNILIKQSVRLLLDIIQSAEYRSLTVSFRAYFDIFCLTLFSV